MEPALGRPATPPGVQLVQMGAPIALRDGSRVHIRQLRHSDRQLLLRGFRRLTPESRVRYRVEIDHHEALIALDEQRNEGVGLARYVRDPARPDAAKVAVTVVDDWQGRGLGTLLLEGITMRAREAGVDTFTALMFAGNRQMMDLLERLGAVRVADRAAGTVEVEVHLPAIGVSPELRKLIRLAAASDIAIPIDQLPRGHRTRRGSA
ncbi:MAG TPA: GNAT family N-acetyltransferase [Actinomycetota bacterium]|nr:GNAT family N-acetyltransferase [Actinomycetota bacterium]